MHPEITQLRPGACSICGMALEPFMAAENSSSDVEYQYLKNRFVVSLVVSIMILMLSMGSMTVTIHEQGLTNLIHTLELLLTIVVVFWGGSIFFSRALDSLRNRSANMFTLIAMGTLSAFLYSTTAFLFPQVFPSAYFRHGELPLYFETASTITVLVLFGQILEMKARSKANRAIAALMEREVKKAFVVKNNLLVEVSIDQVQIGDILRVRPGETVPVDGQIIEGGSTLDESMITGEFAPVVKAVGDSATGGTLNITGSFLMKAEKIGHESLLGKIIATVGRALRSKMPIQELTDQVAVYFVPIVLCISLLSFVVWLIFGPMPAITYALINAVSVLIIACPCAIGLATPMAVTMGMGRGAQMGVLIKSAQALEKMGRVKTLLIDKTGTLTVGKPYITALYPAEEITENELLQIAASIEQQSEHPISKAIVHAAQLRHLPLVAVEHFTAVPGKGIRGIYGGGVVIVGSLRFLKESNISYTNELDSQQAGIYVAFDGKLYGRIVIADQIRESARKSVEILHKLGIRVVILSGDHYHTVKRVATELQVDEFHAELGPLEKLAFIKEMQKQGLHVAMAGDGINDAPALAQADIGIAMGTGTDVALESCQVALVKGDLMGIVRFIHLSRATMAIIKQNIFFAFFYNMLSIPIAAGVFYPVFGLLFNPIIASFAMSMSSLCVVGNSLRLRKMSE